MADLLETAVNAGCFTTLINAAKAAGWEDVLKQPGPMTIFAPSDSALANLPEGALEFLLSDISELKKILSCHVLPGKFMAADLAVMDSVTAMGGFSLKIDTSDGVKISDAKVMTPDIEADNGVIHVIDTVLIPA